MLLRSLIVIHTFVRVSIIVYRCLFFRIVSYKLRPNYIMGMGGLCKQIIYLSPPLPIRTAFIIYPGNELYLTQLSGDAQVQILSLKIDNIEIYNTFVRLVNATTSAPHGYTMLVGQQPSSFTMLPDFGRAVNTLNMIIGPQMTICLTSTVIQMILTTEPLIRSLLNNVMPVGCACGENAWLTTPCLSGHVYPANITISHS